MCKNVTRYLHNCSTDLSYREEYEEMMPTKVEMCKNVTRYLHNCSTDLSYREEYEERPLCKVDMMNMQHIECQEEGESGLDSAGHTCRRVLTCHIGREARRVRTEPRTECEDIPMEEEENCVEMVKLKKKMQMAEYCAFHPKIVCREAEGTKCRKVKRRMCNY